jgi:hypothetical protein
MAHLADTDEGVDAPALVDAYSKYKLADLAHVYEVTPDFARRLIAVLPAAGDARESLQVVLRDDWGFAIEQEPFAHVAALLGV